MVCRDRACGSLRILLLAGRPVAKVGFKVTFSDIVQTGGFYTAGRRRFAGFSPPQRVSA